jgi:hypothetical protein
VARSHAKSPPRTRQRSVRGAIQERVRGPHRRWTELILLPCLSLRFNHEGFCDELYVYRKTPPLVLFADFQAAFLIAG